MKYTITSVIPVMQYGNIQPSIEVEAETFEEAQALVEPKMIALWDKYNPGVISPVPTNRTLIKAFVGGSIYYDDDNHTYTNETGDVYLSGSKYARQFEKEFDTVKISEAMAKKFGVPVEDIVAMWDLKAEISRGFGTAMHKALELYGRYDGLAKTLERQTNLHDHPVIKKAVESFYEGRESEQAEYEIFIVDHDKKWAGQVDRLLITGPKKCRVQDFKTNATIEKNLDNYGYQFDFYSQILEAAGWTVEGQDLFHWNGDWKTYEIERKPRADK